MFNPNGRATCKVLWSVGARRRISYGAPFPGHEPSLFADLMADDAADCCATDRADGAAARKRGASDCTDSGANCGVLVLLRHPGTTTQAEHHCYYKRTN